MFRCTRLLRVDSKRSGAPSSIRYQGGDTLRRHCSTGTRANNSTAVAICAAQADLVSTTRPTQKYPHAELQGVATIGQAQRQIRIEQQLD
jgi:hypothetical protein